MRIDRIDHLVLTVADVDQTVAFYVRVLGMEPVTFGAGRRALRWTVGVIGIGRQCGIGGDVVVERLVGQAQVGGCAAR